MERIPITSSAIKSAGWQQSDRSLGTPVSFGVLELEMTSGAIYRYLDVPERVFEQLTLTPSAGKFYAVEIKSKYVGARVNHHDAPEAT